MLEEIVDYDINGHKQAEKSELSDLERLRAENRAFTWLKMNTLKPRCLGFRSADTQKKIIKSSKNLRQNLNIH